MSKSKSILLISANRHCDPYPVYPIGISYLSTYISKHLSDYKLLVLDLNLDGLNEIDELVNKSDIRYIGVSLRNIDDNNIYTKNSFIDWYKQIVDKAKSVSKAPVIVGGAGFSIFPEFLLEYLGADFGIKGEGEGSFVELVQLLDRKQDVSKIEGLIFKSGRTIIQNKRTKYLRELDLEFNPETLGYYWEKSGMLNIQTKRGCPKRCIYCSYPIIEGTKVRTLEIDTIIKTLRKLTIEQKISYVFFTDSIFNIEKNYNRELCQSIIDNNIKIQWGAYFAPDASLKYEDLELYKKAGLTHIEFGTDSFCDTTLKSYNKSFRFEDVLEKSQICNELCIFFSHFLILGGIGETNLTLKETFENSKQINHSVFFPYIGMRIYPGTELYEAALRKKKIKPGDRLLEPVYYISDDVNLEGIKEMGQATGKKWVFPGDEKSDFYNVLRARKRRGPLWEYLRY